MGQAKQFKVQAEIEDEKKRLVQQVDTLSHLKGALEVQYKALPNASNRDNLHSNGEV